MNTQTHILMCSPDFYGVQYEINPWMNRERKVDHESAVKQWNELYKILVELGVRISHLDPVEGLPDLVFTANAAMIFKNEAILSRFRHEQRQGEETHNADWLAANGFQVRRLPENYHFEGAGDALFYGDTLFSGYRIRSDARSHQMVGEMLGCRVIPLELVDAYFYHLDTCFCPLNTQTAIYYPGAFDQYGQTVLRESISKLIAVDEKDARAFGCNAVVVRKNVVMNVGCDSIARQIRAHGFTAIETPLSEFVKAGGSAKCLTLRLDGEEAAAWKETS